MKDVVKRLLNNTIIVVMIVSMTFSLSGTSVYAASGDTIVYVTKTGECYHSDGCASLSKSKIEVTLESAAKKYRPCSKCKPPKLDATATDSAASPSASVKGAEKSGGADNAVSAEKTVYLSATGKCYHSKDNCGSMNPDKATKVSLSDAEAQGKTKCSKCWK